MSKDTQLQRALAIVEKYGMKGDVIYREIAASSDTETEPKKCEDCHGTGRVEESHKVDSSGRTVAAFGCCDSCEGTGEALTATQQAAPGHGADDVCASCAGSGVVTGMTSHLGPDDYEFDTDCEACHGTGSADIRDAIKALSYQPHTVKTCVQMVDRAEVLRIIDARAALLQASAQREQPITGLCTATDEDDGVVTLHFDSEESAQAFMREYVPSVEGGTDAALSSKRERPCNYPDCKCPTQSPCLQGREQPAASKPDCGRITSNNQPGEPS